MTRFKVFMGFPMLGTVVWLYLTARLHFGPGGDLWLGLWFGFHRPFGMDLRGMHSEGKGSKGMGMGCSSAGILVTYGWILEHELNWRQPCLKGQAKHPFRCHPHLRQKRHSVDGMVRSSGDSSPAKRASGIGGLHPQSGASIVSEQNQHRNSLS